MCLTSLSFTGKEGKSHTPLLLDSANTISRTASSLEIVVLPLQRENTKIPPSVPSLMNHEWLTRGCERRLKALGSKVYPHSAVCCRSWKGSRQRCSYLQSLADTSRAEETPRWAHPDSGSFSLPWYHFQRWPAEIWQQLLLLPAIVICARESFQKAMNSGVSGTSGLLSASSWINISTQGAADLSSASLLPSTHSKTPKVSEQEEIWKTLSLVTFLESHFDTVTDLGPASYFLLRHGFLGS